MAPSSRQGQRPRNQRLRCARSPPTRSIPRQTPSRGRSARLRGCSAAVATLGSRTRRPPARCPPSIPCGAPSPRRLGTAPARAPGAHPPLRARPGRAEREFPSPTGGTPRSRPAPHRGVSPRRATRVPGLRSAAPRPRGAATAPRGSQPHGQPPRCGIPTHRLRGPCPVHRPQHPCHRGPSPAARCRVPNRPADLSEPQGPQPRGQPLTQGVPAPLLRDPDPINRSRHPCRGTRPRSPSPCRGVSPQSGAQPHTRPPLPRHGDPTPGTVPRGRDRRPRSTQTPHPAPLHGAATPGPTPRSPHGRTHGGPPAPPRPHSPGHAQPTDIFTCLARPGVAARCPGRGGLAWTARRGLRRGGRCAAPRGPEQGHGQGRARQGPEGVRTGRGPRRRSGSGGGCAGGGERAGGRAAAHARGSPPASSSSSAGARVRACAPPPAAVLARARGRAPPSSLASAPGRVPPCRGRGGARNRGGRSRPRRRALPRAGPRSRPEGAAEWGEAPPCSAAAPRCRPAPRCPRGLSPRPCWDGRRPPTCAVRVGSAFLLAEFQRHVAPSSPLRAAPVDPQESSPALGRSRGGRPWCGGTACAELRSGTCGAWDQPCGTLTCAGTGG